VWFNCSLIKIVRTFGQGQFELQLFTHQSAIPLKTTFESCIKRPDHEKYEYWVNIVNIRCKDFFQNEFKGKESWDS
jgi:hypothetical protein